MTRHHLALSIAVLLATAPPALAMAGRPTAEPSPAADAAIAREHWQGELKFSGQSLLLGVNIDRLPDGKIVGTIDIPGQGVKGMALANVVKTEGRLSFDLPRVSARFEGELVDGKVIGQWKQGGGSLPLTLAPAVAAAEIRRPQTPKPPFPYRAEEVSYLNAQAGNTLAGTLTLPEGQGPFPAVLLITGSGAQDRDETIMGHKPFLVIADHLTRRGIAVLRVDDRGFGGSTGDPEGTTLDFVTDVEASLAFLRGHRAIRKEAVGLVGHSEGGLIAPIVMAKHPQDVAFLVLLAAPATPGDEVIMDQARAYAELTGKSKAATREQLAMQRKVYEILRTQAPEAAAKSLRALMGQDVPKAPEAQQQLEAQVRAANSAWFRTFIDLDPRPYLAQVNVPVLAISGDRDMNVDPSKHLPGLKAALRRSPAVTTRKLPGLNHLFQPAKTGLPMEYGQIETTFDPQALEVIGDWVEAQTRQGS